MIATERQEQSRTRARAHASSRDRPVRPHPQRFQQTAVAFLVLLAPIFAVLYWLTVPLGHGSWAVVIAAHVAMTLLFGLGVLSYYLTTIWVGSSGITRRNGFGRTQTFPLERIGGLVRLDLHRSGSLDLHPQLFVLDTADRPLMRMHGRYWTQAAIETVITGLGAPVERIPEPRTLRELNAERPELLHRLERSIASRPSSD